MMELGKDKKILAREMSIIEGLGSVERMYNNGALRWGHST